MSRKLILIPLLLILLAGIGLAADIETEIDNFTSGNVDPLPGNYGDWAVEVLNADNCALVGNEAACVNDEDMILDIGHHQEFNLTYIQKSSGNTGYFCANNLEFGIFQSGLCVWFQPANNRWQMLDGTGNGFNTSTCGGATAATYYKARIAFNNSGDGLFKFRNWALGAVEPSTWCLTADYANAPGLTTPIDNGSYRFLKVGGSGASTHNWDNLSNWTAAPPPPPPTGLTLNISTPLPSTNTQFALSTINISATANSSSSTFFNATLWIGKDGVPVNNRTINFASGFGVYVNFSVDLTFGNWSYFISITNNNSQLNSSEQYFYTDTTDPQISTTSFTNTSFYFQNNVTGWFNFTDDFSLFSFNFSVDGSPVIGFVDLFNSSINYSFSYDASSLAIGEHELSVRVADGHTAQELGGDYDWSNGLFNDYIRFEFYDEGWVKIDGESIFDSFTAAKKTDRYTFDYEPNTLKDTYTFKVTSDQYINIFEKSGYYGDRWLIVGDHWLDFDLPGVQVTTKRIADNEIDVTIDNFESKSLMTFNSIGDLNVITQNYTFHTTNATVTFSGTALVNQQQTTTFKINKTGSINSTWASLFYNGSQETVVKTSFTNYDFFSSTFFTPFINGDSANMTLVWNYTIIGLVNNETGNITNNQTIFNLNIDNCSTFTQRAVNITTLVESDSSYISTDIGAYFELWIDDPTNFTALNLTWSGDHNYGICIFPNWANVSVYGQLEYQDTETNFSKKTYYFVNTSFNNQTQNLNLYLTNDTSIVTFNVRDENDDVIEGAIIKVLSYDLTTNTFKTTEILQTDSNGNALGNIILNTQWYQFSVEFNGIVLLFTEPTKITSTTQNFRVNLVTDYFENYDIFLNVATTLSFNNATRTFTYTFSDPTSAIREGCLEITRRTSVADTVINSSCLTSTAGTIYLAINENVSSNTYIGTGYININPKFITNMLNIDFDELWREFGGEGLLLSFLIVVVLVTVGVFSPIAAVALAIIGVVMMFLLGFYHLSWPFIMMVIIMGGIAIYRMNKT